MVQGGATHCTADLAEGHQSFFRHLPDGHDQKRLNQHDSRLRLTAP
jgi:hypothetical protein